MMRFIKENLLAILVCLFLGATIASATIITRPYTAADYAGGQKAVGPKVNDEFNNIVDWLNQGNITSINIATGGVTSINLANGAVTSAKIETGAVTSEKMAVGSNAYIKNYRQRCGLTYQNGNTVYLEACDIIVDGARGKENSATPLLLPNNMDTGSLPTANSVAYVYASVDLDGSLSPQISAATPNITTMRKSTDSTKRYLGSLFIGTSSSIAQFSQNGPEYRVNRGYDINNDPVPLEVSSVSGGVGYSPVINVPNFASYVLAQTSFGTGAVYADFTGAGYCNTLFLSGQFYSFGTETALTNVYMNERFNITSLSQYERLPLVYTGSAPSRVYAQYSDCDLDDPSEQAADLSLSVFGWVEPWVFY